MGKTFYNRQLDIICILMYDSDDYIYIYIQKFNERKDNVSVCLSFKDG